MTSTILLTDGEDPLRLAVAKMLRRRLPGRENFWRGNDEPKKVVVDIVRHAPEPNPSIRAARIPLSKHHGEVVRHNRLPPTRACGWVRQIVEDLPGEEQPIAIGLEICLNLL